MITLTKDHIESALWISGIWLAYLRIRKMMRAQPKVIVELRHRPIMLPLEVQNLTKVLSGLESITGREEKARMTYREQQAAELVALYSNLTERSVLNIVGLAIHSCWIIEIRNAGRELVKSILVAVPDGVVAEVSRDGSPMVTTYGPEIRIEELLTERSVTIVAWTSSQYAYGRPRVYYNNVKASDTKFTEVSENIAAWAPKDFMDWFNYITLAAMLGLILYVGVALCSSATSQSESPASDSDSPKTEQESGESE